MSDSGVFEVYGVAHDLGLEDLCQHCEDHLTTTITPHSASTFLMAALNMEHRTGGNYILVTRNIIYLDKCGLRSLS